MTSDKHRTSGKDRILENLPIEQLRAGARYYENGKVHVANSDYQEAIESFLEAMRITAPDAVILCDIAFCYFLLNESDQCIKYLKEALELEPASTEAVHNLSMMLVDTEIEQAEELARKAVGLEPTSAKAWWNLGRVLFRRSNLSEAMTALATSIGLAPDDPLSHLYLGRVLAQMNKVERAERAFLEAVRLSPTDAEILLDYGRFLIGQKRFKDAEVYLREALDETGGLHHTPLTVLAESLIGQAKVRAHEEEIDEYVHEALTLLNQSLDINMDDGKTWFHQGEICLFLKDYEYAEKFFRTSIELGYDEPWAYGWLSAVLRRLGRKQEATEMFEEFKRRGG
ncbi:MAG: tetratricopeptide repeat protein [Candidatus Thorarchaeota archaeon]